MLALRRFQPAQLVSRGPNKLHLRPVLEARLDDCGVVGNCLLALVEKLLVLRSNGSELFQALVEEVEGRIGQ